MLIIDKDIQTRKSKEAVVLVTNLLSRILVQLIIASQHYS
jgi:hypothetical protein